MAAALGAADDQQLFGALAELPGTILSCLVLAGCATLIAVGSG